VPFSISIRCDRGRGRGQGTGLQRLRTAAHGAVNINLTAPSLLALKDAILEIKVEAIYMAKECKNQLASFLCRAP
jgi:tRNA(Met) C34 N-acetyltransferase TmcA